MKQPKLTPWYPASVKPVRPGVYEVHFDRDCAISFKRWTGRRWVWLEIALRSDFGRKPGDKWRGLAQDPKAKV